MAKESKKKKRRIYSKFTTMVLGILLIVLFCLLFFLKIIPILYLIIILLVIVLIYLFIIKFSFSKKRIKRLLAYLISTPLIILLCIIDLYLASTLDVFSSIKASNTKIENYNVIVLKKSNYDDIKELKKQRIGIKEIHNNDGLEKAKKYLVKKINPKYKEYEDIALVSENLLDKNVEAIVLEDAEIKIIEEENPEIYENFKIIYKFEIKVRVEDLTTKVNILKEPFNIYISGVDTFGKIESATRSDVNMLLTINPKEELIHITWVPRDYYVHINGSTYKDKLTHAGIYGIDKSIYAMENLLDSEVNYYVKINFTSLIKIVDAIGGIDVYNDESFTSQDNYYYRKGEIHLNGEKALSFVRERKNVSGGDLGRGKNQVKVLKALINKVASPKIITKYVSLMDSLEGSFVTNLDLKNISKYLENEIRNPKDYEITSYTLTGTNGYDYTYSYKKSKLYVMIPDEESVKEAKEKINEVKGVED